MKPLFFKVLFYRYLHASTKWLKALGFIITVALFINSPFAVYGFFCNKNPLPPFLGVSILWSFVLVYLGMGLNLTTTTLLCMSYAKKAIQHKNLDTKQWPKNTTPSEPGEVDTMMLYGGWIGVFTAFFLIEGVFIFLVGFIKALVYLITIPLIPFFNSLMSKLKKGMTHLFYNLTHIQEVMEEKNQQFLENNPEKAAKILSEKLNKTLPKAQADSNTKRL